MDKTVLGMDITSEAYDLLLADAKQRDVTVENLIAGLIQNHINLLRNISKESKVAEENENKH